MTDTTKNELLEKCKRIANTLENPPLVNDNCEQVDYIETEDGDFIVDAIATPTLGEVSKYNTGDESKMPFLIYDGDIYGEDHGTTIVQDIENNRWIIGGKIVDLQPLSGYYYLSDVLDIEYRVSADREFIGAEILVTFGGPNIWIDTKNNRVYGAWASDRAEWSYIDNIGLEEAANEMWDCR